MTRDVFAALCLLLVAGCGSGAPDASPAKPRQRAASADSVAAPDSRGCDRATGVASLKAAIFARAKTIRPDAAGLLDRLAGVSVARLEGLEPQGSDDALAATVCRATFVLDLPPGTVEPLTGANRLAARFDYSAQQTSAGVQYRLLSAADPIAYPLAAIGLSAKQSGVVLPPAPATPVPGEVPGATARAEARPMTTGAGETVAAAPVAAPTPVPAAASTTAVASRAAASRPSFDCGSAQSEAEQIVCGDAYLARLDRAVSERYALAYRSTGPGARDRLERTRDRFLDRLDRCQGWACVEDAYHDRLEQIDRISSRD